MKKFIIDVTIFLLLVLASIAGVFLLANGKSDAYYVRFTTPKQHSLIIGTSRAAQGLQPAVFDSLLYKNSPKHFFNYAFTITDSPFGPAYLESIENKLDPAEKDGIFIVTVDPWSLCGAVNKPGDTVQFREEKSFIGKTKQVNLNPNIPYLVQSYAEPYVNIIRKWRSSTDMFLHNDGWLQIDVGMDSASVAKRRENKMADYRKNYLPVYKFSATRFNYLQQTIRFLQQHGKVYLVRLPVHAGMFEIEDELIPDFDNRITSLAGQMNTPFLNFKTLPNNYLYVDGNHLYKTSGREVSAIIANWVAGSR